MSCSADVGTVDQVKVTLTTSYRWKIKDFSSASGDSGSSLLSPVFTTADSSVKWHLKLYPNGKTDKESDYLSMSVYYCSEIETGASYELSIVNAENEALEDFTMKKKLTLVADFESQSEAWIPYRLHPKFVKRSFIEDPDNRVLMNDCLTISFEVVLQNPVISPSAGDDEDMKDARLKEFDDFEKLLENDQYSDVTFIVEDKKIRAHKIILSTRNAVFKEAFKNSAKDEEQKSVVEISDLKYPVLKELFRFLYTGKVKDVYRMADDLFVVADEYRVTGLKIFCEKTLCSQLEVDNALELFVIADLHDAKILKEQVLEFIADRADEIVEKDEFASLRPDLMREIIRAMARKKVIADNE